MAAASPAPNDTAQDGSTETAQQAAALEARIDQLTQAIAAQGDSTGQLTALIGNLQQQVASLAPAATPAGPAAPNEEFQRLYQDIPGYIKQVAIEANREVLGPHLAQQATQTRDAMLAQARAGVDGEYGDGTWDEHFSKDVLTTIKDLPLEMQASRQHLEAAIAAVLGRQYLDPAGAEKLESRRSKAKKAKEESMNMLPNGRPRPSRPDQLDDRERAFLDSLQRSGIDYDESRYKTAKGAGRTIEEWEAANAPKKGK